MDKIEIITINNPKAKNALSNLVLNDINEKLNKLLINENIRAVIFTGEGNEAFCAGADLKERLLMSEDEALSTVKTIQNTINRIAQIPVPTIAAMNGLAFGGGLELSLACDLRFASHDVQMGLTECSLGVIPGGGGTQRLPKIVGLSKSLELIFTAKKLNAKEALDIGLIDNICLENENVLEYAKKIAQVIANQAPLCIKASKKAVYQSFNFDLDYELKCYEEILYTDDRKEGLLAFKEKRNPNFLGK